MILENKSIIEMLRIYNNAFPSLQTNETIFSERLMLNNGSEVFEHRADDVLAGYSVINDDGILLICVDENYRKRGIGRKLLQLSENHIKRNFNKIRLGSSRNTYLLCGVPMSDSYNSPSFFRKYGYKESWISYDMTIDLETYNRIEELDNKDNNIIIRLGRNDWEDIEKIVRCGDMLDGWGEFYRNASEVLVAELEGEIIGAVIVEPQSSIFSKSLEDAGVFACLGVLEEYRNLGIGMKLCQEALCSLKSSGCKVCHIGYTWLDWWYGKLGAEKYVNYWMGEKVLEI